VLNLTITLKLLRTYHASQPNDEFILCIPSAHACRSPLAPPRVCFSNDTTTRVMILRTGGTVSLLEFSREMLLMTRGWPSDGDFFLNPGD